MSFCAHARHSSSSAEYPDAMNPPSAIEKGSDSTRAEERADNKGEELTSSNCLTRFSRTGFFESLKLSN